MTKIYSIRIEWLIHYFISMLTGFSRCIQSFWTQTCSDNDIKWIKNTGDFKLRNLWWFISRNQKYFISFFNYYILKIKQVLMSVIPIRIYVKLIRAGFCIPWKISHPNSILVSFPSQSSPPSVIFIQNPLSNNPLNHTDFAWRTHIHTCVAL